jgi:drug/metabolite transporter (DMT)-like permease
MAAIVVGAVAYAAGSILGTGRAADGSVAAVAAWQMLVGGGALVAVALAVEPVGPALDGGLRTPAGWASLGYLAGVGSLVGFTVYLWLLRRWPASRVAAYAFVSPVVAVVLGAVLLGETLFPHQGVAALLLLGGAALALGSRG